MNTFDILTQVLKINLNLEKKNPKKIICYSLRGLRLRMRCIDTNTTHTNRVLIAVITAITRIITLIYGWHLSMLNSIWHPSGMEKA